MFGLVVVFTACVALMAYLGWLAGFKRSLVNTLAGLAGLICSTLFTPLVVTALGHLFNPLAVWLFGGIAIFFAASVLLKRVFTLLLEPLQLNPLADRLGGLAVNASVGGIFGGLLVWSFSFVGCFVTLEEGHLVSAKQTALQKYAGQGMGFLLEITAQSSGLSPIESRLVGAISANPGAWLGDAQQFLRAPSLLELLRDKPAQELLRSGHWDALRTQPLFRHQMLNPGVQDVILRLGDEGVDDVETRVATQLIEFWTRYDKVLQDAAVVQFMSQPQVAEKIDQGDWLGLMMLPDFSSTLRHVEQLVENVMRSPVRPPQG